MAILNNSNAISTAGGYDINNSLRFRSSASAYLNRTPTSAGSQTTWTISAWVKRGSLGTEQHLFDCGTTVGTNVQIGFLSGDGIYIYNGNNTTTYRSTSAVFRDPSSWYHLVIVLDTSNATAASRCRIYVNGVEQVYSTSATITLNSTTPFNSNIAHNIGRYPVTGAYYFDGYLTEVNFIDGQALTPSSFGETDTTTGVWKPKAYSGTYGTNGFYLPFSKNSVGFSSYYGSFNGSGQYLSTASNTVYDMGSGDFTVEAFVYQTSQTGYQVVTARAANASTYSTFEIGISGGTPVLYVGSSASAYGVALTSSINAQLNTWTHIAATRNGNTFTIWINGVSGGTATYSGSAYANSSTLGMGGYPSGTNLLSGRISNLRIVKGTSVYTASFTPPTSALTSVSGTSLLTLQNATIIDNSGNSITITNTGSVTTTSATVGNVALITSDQSGNNNNWTPNNINYSTAGTTYDAMKDSPTNTSATVANYAVWSPLVGSVGVTLSQANLSATFDSASGTRYGTIGTIGVSSGKWYWEYEFSAGGNSALLGITQKPFAVQMGTWPGEQTGDYGYYGSNGNKYTAGSGSAYGATFTTGDIIGVALDLDAGTLTFYKNNSSQGTAFSSISGTFFPAIGKGITATGITSFVNFGQRPFTYTPPTGYVALNTYNLPTPTILQGNKYMDASLWTGDSTSPRAVVSTLNFKPDFVWTKVRSNTYSNTLYDSVRGGGQALFSDTTGAEQANYVNGYIQSFNSNGWTMQNGSSGGIVLNNSGQTYVAWQWQAGQGSTSSNTSGSITSTVSVNTTAGFSIVTYTGTGANATVGHGLGVAPAMMIFKERSAAGNNWSVYHKSIGNTGRVFLDLTNATSTSITAWNNTSPTSTVFTVGTSAALNANGSTMIGYCWAEIAGFSKFGSYTGNGSTDGPFVATNFAPKFIMIKRTDTTANWIVMDTSRGLYNASYYYLLPNLSDADSGPIAVDFLSNGFKMRLSNAPFNASGGTYIYAAYAENPFKNANAR